MTIASDEPTHYFAEGKRIDLTASATHVAINPSKAADLGERRLNDLRAHGDPLTEGILLLERACLTADELAALERAGGKIPVYDADGGLIIPLPEIIIPSSRGDHGRILARIGAPPGIAVTRKDSRRNHLVLAPASGLASDVFRLAAEVSARLNGVEASPNFLRLCMA